MKKITEGGEVMSKIYNKYLELKEMDSNKLYLFRVGMFYIFIADDCDLINDYVVLKKVKFTNQIKKCGFPANVLSDYLRVFKNHDLDIEIIEDFTLINGDRNLYDYIMNIDINNITPLESMKKLQEIKEIVENEKRS